tara:strand:+ start:934 stop:1281 length:348 start_codon:yes stop_codon:yes gene_type:complete
MIITAWTLIIYFIKKDFQKSIKTELNNLLDILKKFFFSLKDLIQLLASISLEEIKATPMEESLPEKDEKILNIVRPIKDQSVKISHNADEDNDEALSSFSPEVVDVINEEEEKVA